MNPDNKGIKEERKNLIDLVLGAYLSIRHPIAYVSMPITSGKILYDVLEKKGVRNIEELIKQDPNSLYNDIIKPNVEMGIMAADNLDTKLPPIAPSVFEAKKFRWSQEDYMSLWLKVIEERAEEMHMTDGWEYSNGGVQEFVRAMQMQFLFAHVPNASPEFYQRMRKITVFDLNKKELRLNDGFNKIKESILDLNKRGFPNNSLRESVRDLYNINGFFISHGTSASEWHMHMKYYLDFARLDKEMEEIINLKN